MQRRFVRFAVMAAFATVAASAHGQTGDWGNLAIISSTLGNNANRLCIGEGLRDTDIGCPTYAPYVSSSGNVGIGTTSPAVRLHVAGALRLAGTDGLPMVAVQTPAGNWPTMFTTSGGDLAFGEQFNTVQQLTIRRTSGNVGIGTTNPNAKLDVYGTISATNLLINGQPVGGQADRITSGTTNVIATQDRSVTITTSGTQRVVIGENGNVGIGVANPSALLDVNGGYGLFRNGILLAADSGAWRSSIAFNSYATQYDARDAHVFRTYLVERGRITASGMQVSGSFIVSTSAQTTTPSLYVGTNGNVGVGTASPGTRLSIAGASNVGLRVFEGTEGNHHRVAVTSRYIESQYAAEPSPRFKLGDGVTGSRAGLGFTIGTSNMTTHGAALDSPAVYTLALYTGDGASLVERVRINASGNVGIATIAPAATLQVSGSFIVSTSAQTTTPSLYVGTNGNVGVGTSAPESQFQVSSNALLGSLSVGSTGSARNIVGNSNGVAVKNSSYYGWGAGATDAGGIPDTKITRLSAGKVSIDTSTNGNAEGTLIASNVGIGTTNPNAKLDVYGTISATNLLINGQAVGGQADRITSGTTNVIATEDRSVTISTAGSQRVVIGENGNVGIGTNAPAAALHVRSANANGGNGNLVIDDTNTQGADTGARITFRSIYTGSSITQGSEVRQVKQNSSAGDYGFGLAFATRPHLGSITERLRVDSTGKVGIGTTTPSATLMVSGSAIVSGTIQVAGTGNEACTPGTLGTIRFNPTTGAPQICVQR